MEDGPNWTMWTDEDGKIVRRVAFMPYVYTDDISLDLSLSYDLSSIRDFGVPSSLGSTGHESTAAKILAMSKFYGRIVGMEREQLGVYLDAFNGRFCCSRYSLGALEARGLLRPKKVRGLEVLFPTQELLESQKVRKKKQR